VLKTILIVDDSENVRQQLRQALTPMCYRLVEADDGEAGYQQACTVRADLIIADVNMPRLDGLAMLERIRRLPGHVSTPVFVLTTETSPGLLRRGRELGATAWVIKPFSTAALLRAVAKVTGE
jgi:two-component system, chemotaxis family, chemotaxis protein CheY